MSKKAIFLTLSPIYLALFMGDALLSSYYALYFIENGLNSFEQSLLLALIPFSLFLGSFALSWFAKTPKRTLWLFRIAATMETGLAFSFAFCNTFVSLLIVTILVSFFNGAPFTFLESLGSVKAEKGKVPYANIRMFGTLGYIISLALGGLFLRYLPFNNIYFIASGLFALTLPLSFLIKPLEKEEEKEEVIETKKSVKGFGIALLIAIALFYGGFLGASFILPIYLKNLGLPDADYSLIRSAGIGAEFITLLLLPLLNEIFSKNKKIPLFISAFFLVLSVSFAIYIEEAYLLAFLFLILSSIGKAFLFAYQALLFEETIGKKKLGTILTLSNGLVNMIAGSLSLTSSSIYENVSFSFFFLMIVLLEVGGTAFLLYPKGKEKLSLQEENKK